MEVLGTNHNLITDCACCGKVISTKREGGLNKLHDVHMAHVESSKKCKEYFESLPSLDDLHRAYGINIVPKDQ